MKRGFLNNANKTASTSKPASPIIASSIQPPKTTSIAKNPLPTTKINSIEALSPQISQDVGLSALVVTRFPMPSPFDICLPPPFTLLHAQATIGLVFSGTKEALYRIPGFVKRLQTPSQTGWPFVIKDVPNRGKGLFSRESIQPGQMILIERPLALMPVALQLDPNHKPSPDEILSKIPERMNPDEREEFFSLHNCKGPSVSLIQGILDTNTLAGDTLPGPYSELHGVVGRATSRINHSCTPNADYRFDIASMSICVFPLRTLEKGEEVFISYTDHLSPRERRRSELLRKYSFICKCFSCTLPKEESKRSNIRRGLLSAATDRTEFPNPTATVMDWANNPALLDDHLIKPSLRIMNMMTEEGYTHQVALWDCAILSLAYCALGDGQAAIRWAKKWTVINTTFSKGDNTQIALWEEFVKGPEKSPLWKLRLRTTSTHKNSLRH